MESGLDGTDMALNSLAARNCHAIRSYQILRQLGLEMLPGLQIPRVELVVESDQKLCALGDGVGGRRKGILGDERKRSQQRESAPYHTRAKRTHGKTSIG